MALLDVKVPNLGDFRDVEIIEVHVKPGDKVAAEAPLITLETDKAAMEVPAPAAGVEPRPMRRESSRRRPEARSRHAQR